MLRGGQAFEAVAMSGRLVQALQRVDRVDLHMCLYLNRSSGVGVVNRFFRAVSWLGDGWLWYALIATLPIAHGDGGWLPAGHMAITGAFALLLYKAVKRRAVRERPFVTHSAVRCAAAPLDRYSFPSGHTLHAVAFTVVMVGYFPEWAWPLSGFTLLVALSRVILGLHYPTDVAAGALIGGTIGMLSLNVVGPSGI